MVIQIRLGWYVFAALSVAAIPPARADVPDTLPLQGVLTDSDGVPIDGTPNLEFAIFNVESGGTEVWSETHTAFPVADGFFTVYLGETTALDAALLSAQPELWMEVSVNGEPLERFQLGSLPYAFESAVCRQVGSLEEGDIQPLLSDTNACAAGYYLRGWDATLGEPICALDTFASGDFSGVIQVVAGAGITVNSTDAENPVVAVDPTVVQTRLNATCAGNNYVKSIDPATGAVTCAIPPNDDTFAAVTCSSGGQLLEWSGSAWVCADDIATELYADAAVSTLAAELSDGNNTTTPVGWADLTGVPGDIADGDNAGVTSITEGTGISVDDSTPSAPEVSVDMSGIQPRLSSSCSPGDFVQSIDPATGEVNCSNPGAGANSSAISVEADGTQGIPADVETKVEFETVIYDEQSEYADSRFTAKTEGKYLVEATVTLATTVDTNLYRIIVYKNGSVANRSYYRVVNNTTYSFPVSNVYQLGVDDYLEIYFRHSDSAVRTVSGSPHTFFSVTKLQ